MSNIFTYKIYYYLILILTCYNASLLVANLYEPSPKPPMLCLTMENKGVLPRNFRTTYDPFAITISLEKKPTRLGLDELNASGSAQFSEKSFLEILKTLPINTFNLVIVDLREESHGFINGNAVTWRGENDWGNMYKSDEEILSDESQRLETALYSRTAIIHHDKNDLTHASSVIYRVDNVQLESDLVTSFGVDYYRLTITDHIRPSDDDVDTFITFVRQLPQETWIHFHCAAGKGRTSTFLTMYDMMHNAKQVSMDDIFRRQALIGGKDFNEQPDQNTWNYSLSYERIQFLRHFYHYCHDSNDFTLSWSAWNTINLK